MTSRCVLFLDFIVICECLSHNGNQEVQKMDHQEEDGSNPENVENWFLCGFTKTVSSNVELSQGDLESVWNTSHQGGVVNSLIFEIFNCHAIEFQLVCTQLHKTEWERKSKDAENDNEPEYVFKNEEDDSYDTCDLVNNLHEVQRFGTDNKSHETDSLSLSS